MKMCLEKLYLTGKVRIIQTLAKTIEKSIFLKFFNFRNLKKIIGD